MNSGDGNGNANGNFNEDESDFNGNANGASLAATKHTPSRVTFQFISCSNLTYMLLFFFR